MNENDIPSFLDVLQRKLKKILVGYFDPNICEIKLMDSHSLDLLAPSMFLV